jgi:hypothetical protein
VRREGANLACKCKILYANRDGISADWITSILLMQSSNPGIAPCNYGCGSMCLPPEDAMVVPIA